MPLRTIEASSGRPLSMKPFPVAILTLLAVLTQTPLPLHAAAPMPVEKVEKQSDGVLLHMKPGVLKIQVCMDRIIRVIYAPMDIIPSTLQDFVVTKQWTPVPFNLKESPATVTVSTEKLTVQIDRTTGQVQFFDAKDAPILQEVAGGGKTMTPVTVNGESSYQPEQSFTSPDDEV